ncbi:carbohydrate ABC transporter permease [Alicyclobacillus fastidiosus]|uniref:Carbohydrate ABC transporter permease n=1 Tax=Alicyclobacillus fastidiosus TaxID=392011 RepID=A0ABV5AA48_9BACL|nr:carbohydrate ABC transporter permease [Alicyclobacillus fastidiosus]WEH07722.1 carbohydrate ABC transporter permease [Alicyclobacillus fastidiosus]
MAMAQSDQFESRQPSSVEEIRKLDRSYFVKRMVGRVIVYAILIFLTMVCLLPFYSMIISATHSNSDIATKLLLLPGGQLLANYHRLMQTVNVWRGFGNSIVIAVSSTVLSLYFSALTAYGFAKYRFKGSKLLFGSVLASMMVPGQLGIIGFFQLMHGFHMLNTYWPLILPSIANAFGVFFLKQICDESITDELIEAARIDGASEVRIFHRLALPLLMPGMSALAIFFFIGNWNSFLNPLIILFDNNLQPLPVMIAMTQGSNFTDYGAQYVGVAISVVPIIIVFAILSKRIIGGLSVGSLKG